MQKINMYTKLIADNTITKVFGSVTSQYNLDQYVHGLKAAAVTYSLVDIRVLYYVKESCIFV